MFFERRCPICEAATRRVCPACVSQLKSSPALQIAGIDHALALLAYDDLSARIVLAAKNGGRRDLLRWSAGHLATHLARSLSDRSVTIDTVSWVPAHPAQRRTRGYDQGEILARTVGRRLGIRCRPTLRRLSGSSRKGLARIERLDGPSVRSRRRTEGSVLLVDDVVTTGTSLRRCADALRESGVERVEAAMLAASTGASRPLQADSRPTIYCGDSSDIHQQQSERSLHGGIGQWSSYSGSRNPTAAGNRENRAARSIFVRNGPG